MKLPTLKQCEKAVGEPAASWVSRCHEIALKLVAAGLVPGGVAVYGHFTGEIDPKSHFASSRTVGFCRHGWVKFRDGRVFDPTRWVFEHVKPYIFVGPDEDYDEGGNQFRSATLGQPPEFDPDEKRFSISSELLPSEPWTFVEKVLRIDYAFTRQEPGELSEPQLIWLANANYETLLPHTPVIYRMLEALDLGAFIPLDNANRAKREAAALFPGRRAQRERVRRERFRPARVKLALLMRAYMDELSWPKNRDPSPITRAYQLLGGLPPDGYCGPVTQRLVAEDCKDPDGSSAAVSEEQVLAGRKLSNLDDV